MSNLLMTYYGYISDHSFSSKSTLFVVLSHSYPISGLEDSLKTRSDMKNETYNKFQDPGTEDIPHTDRHCASYKDSLFLDPDD